MIKAPGGGTACGGSPWPKPPRPQSRAAGSLAHPFLRRCEAMPASLTLSRRSRTPATLLLGRKNKYGKAKPHKRTNVYALSQKI